MKCFNHIEREAVATCQKCGKGLCRECAEKYTPCMCEPCAEKTQRDKQQQAQNKEEQRTQKYKNALVDTRSEFIKTSVIGIIVGVLWVWFMKSQHSELPVSECALDFFMGFCIPFGWKALTYLQSFIPLTLFGTWWFWFIYLIVKAVLSIFVGMPALIYQLVKTILTQRKINRLN